MNLREEIEKILDNEQSRSLCNKELRKLFKQWALENLPEPKQMPTLTRNYHVENNTEWYKSQLRHDQMADYGYNMAIGDARQKIEESTK